MNTLMGAEDPSSDRAGARFAAPAILVALVLVTAALVAPWGAAGFDDDWSYAAITRELAATGGFRTNGWISPMLGVLALLGAQAIRIFGDSADTLRGVTLALHCAGVVTAYALARRLGATRTLAFFAAAAIGLSPTAVPLSNSFMSDVPGLAAMLGCVLFATIAWQEAAAGRARYTLVALALSAAIGYCAGTIRQVAWSVPLGVLALFAWDHRRDRRMAVAGVAALVAVGLGAWLTQRWFESVSSTTKLVARTLPMAVAHPKTVALHFVKAALTAAIALLPVTWAWRAAWTPAPGRRSPVRFAVALVGIGALLVAVPALRVPPWIGNTVNPGGIMGEESCIGTRPDLLPPWIRATVLAAALTPLLAWVARTDAFRCEAAAASRTSHRATLAALAALTGATLLHFAISGVLTDRYLMPIVALAALALLTRRSEGRAAAPGVIAWGLAAAMWAYGVAAAHDYFALVRARQEIVLEAMRSGVARERITAGYELDGLVQLERAGHADDGVPAYQGRHGTCPAPSPYAERIWTLKMSTAIQPTHFVVASLQDWLDPTPAAEVTYTRWLPPGTASVWIQRER